MKRLLTVNLYFEPRSFGGATIVAEELARRVHASGEWEVSVLSYSNYGWTPEPTLIRSRLPGGIDQYTVNTGLPPQPWADFHNPAMTEAVREVIAQFRPDAAHVHCIQGLGAGVIEALAEADVPTLLTTHDYWWLCEKIFMLDADGRYCGQEVIDKAICRKCVVDASILDERWTRALAALRRPAAITYPSRHARAQYERNGAPAETGHVLPNGVTPPGPGYPALRAAKPSKRLRFGYVGGPGPLKGWGMIERAFAGLDPEKVELIAVDAATNRGESWWREYRFGKLAPLVTVVPGYTRETLDEFFAGIDVLLFLSTWKETFGLTSREAALRGVHVLATDCGAPVEPLTDGETATIIPGLGSARDLRRAVKRLVAEGLPKPGPAALKKLDDEIVTYDDQATEVLRRLNEITSPAT